MINIQKLHDLIGFVLAEASQDEDWRSRELGPIHIIKYVYLADMYYAAKKNGKTFTGINWQFYHFGPWNLDLYKEIPDAVKVIGGNIRTFESQYDQDGVRFSLKGDYLDDYSNKIPSSILLLLRRDISNFGSATNDLLHYVYTTPPMTNASPGETIVFTHDLFLKKQPCNPESVTKLTVREKKKRKKRIECIREKIAKKYEEKKKKRIKPTPPRYDEVFFHGTMELDQEFEKEQIEDHKGVLQVNKNAWAGEWRKCRDLP